MKMRTLETKNLVLRKFAYEDFDNVHSYASCVENVIYMVWGPNGEEQTRQFISMAIKEAEKEPCTNYQYAVILKATGKLIGACNLCIGGYVAEIGWILHRDYQKQGYGTEMGKRLVEFGFEVHNLHRIIALCDAENYGSFRVMENIGMRREGLYIDSRPAFKGSKRRYSDELSYSILRDDWETAKEIQYYNSLPCIFNGFIDVPELSDNNIRLVCVAKNAANPEKKYCPSYSFIICKGSEKVGDINLRIGYSGFGPDLSSLYYGGQIGYSINEEYRGNGYAVAACRLIISVAKAHGMTKLLITNDVRNTASRRVCEKLCLTLIRTARMPEWNDLYAEGQRYLNIYEMTVE